MTDPISILNCPNEILSEISRYVLPEDLENFALTSCRIHVSCLPLLPGHRARVHRYRSITLQTGCPGPLERLLRDVLNDPLKARYITRLKVDGRGAQSKDVERIAECLEQYDANFFIATAPIDQRLTKQPFTSLFYREETQDWVEICRPNMLLAILLLLLPNLTTLEIYQAANSEPDEWLPTILSIALTQETPALTKLRFAHLSGCTTAPYSLNCPALLIALPSVQFVAVPYVCPFSDKWKDYQPPCLGNNVTNLELCDSLVSPEDLCELLRYCSSLKSLVYICAKYSDRANCPDNAEAFNASPVRSALLARATKTLRELTISAPNQNSCFSGSLRDFEALQELCIDWNILLPDKGAGVTPQILSEQLPKSLQTLDIHDQIYPNCHSRQDYHDLIESAASLKSWHTHRVRDTKITFDDWVLLPDHGEEDRQALEQRSSFLDVALVSKKRNDELAIRRDQNAVTRRFAE